MKKPLILVVAVAIAIGAFVACKPSQPKSGPDQDKPLVVGFENDIVSLDPIRIADVYSFRVVSQIFEGLASHSGPSNCARASSFILTRLWMKPPVC